jgi:glycosyltransferase involved in cell wall biosynthesis
MRLLIDLQGMQNSSRDRGIGRYIGALARGVLRNSVDCDVRLVLSDLFPERIEEIIASFAGLAEPEQFHIFSGVGPTAALHDPNRWRSMASQRIYEKFISDLAPDALLIGSLFEGGADNTVVSVGPADRPYVVATILYDLIPLLNPSEHIASAGARRWYFDKVAQGRQADLLLGISASACREGIEHLPSDENHVVEIGAAAAEEFATIDLTALHRSELTRDVLNYHGITRPFLMHASALDPRKNFEGLIEAFARLPQELRSAHQLVLVCKLNLAGQARLQNQIARYGLDEDDVILTGFVPDDELRVLYANCALFVFPSFHEGFGLPVLEAMWCGAPAVGSNLSSVPEVIGLEEALFNPNDMDDMVKVIGRGLCDTQFRTRLLDHAVRHVRNFSWDEVAKRALAAIKSKLSKSRLSLNADDQSMARLISELAAIKSWPGPSDTDLMSAARALDRNECQRWSIPDFHSSLIPSTESLC